MEFMDTQFREDFPLLCNILLGNNPNHDLFHGSTENNNRLIGDSYTFGHCSLEQCNVVGSSLNPFSRMTAPTVSDSLNSFPATDNGVFLNLGQYQPNVGDQYVHPYNETHVVHDRNVEFLDFVAPMNLMLPEGNFDVDHLTKKLPKKLEERKKIEQVRAKGKSSRPNATDSVSKANIIKGQWTAQEDSVLIQLVREYGVSKWSQIAKNFNGRVGKQCRERWHNHLRPDIRKDMWSEEEDRILVAAHRVVGNKWAEIAKCLHGRTENSIKNHWNTTKRRELSKRSRFGLYVVATATNPNDSSSSSYFQNYVKSVCAATPTLHLR